MKTKILKTADSLEVTVGTSAVIAVASYENLKPFYSIKGVFSEKVDIDKLLQEMKDKVNQQLQIDYNNAIAQRLKDMRFYERNGLKYISVTEVLNHDAKFFMKPEELNQYAAKGTMYNIQLDEFVKTGKWQAFSAIPECIRYLHDVETGTLRLPYDELAIRNFLKDYPINFDRYQVSVFNDDHIYAGTLDYTGSIPKTAKWEKLDVLFDVPTLFDLKVGSPDKMKALKQMSAYSSCPEMKDIRQVCMINITDKNKCGYAVPVVSQGIDEYFKMFLQDRREFKRIYGI